MTKDITKCVECEAKLSPCDVRFWIEPDARTADDYLPLCGICFDARDAKQRAELKAKEQAKDSAAAE